MRPFLRWAGGKRWLAKNHILEVPSATVRLIEPFLGGGALFFSKPWASAVLADINPFLINAYRRIRSDPEAVFELVTRHFRKHSNERYYSVRARMAHNDVQDAADFIYLNRACFNGLFRVNLAGRFNVPLGSKLYALDDKSEFESWSQHLQSAEIKLADFAKTISLCGEGDFIFADPPYTVNHNSNGFIEYNEQIFSWDDQVRLHNALVEAKGRGARFVLTNADHSTIRDLYAGCQISTVERGSEMAGKTTARGRTTEVVITL